MTNSETTQAYVQALRALAVLPDRAAAGDFGPGGYATEWRRLDAEKAVLARQLTPDEIKAAYEAASFMC